MGAIEYPVIKLPDGDKRYRSIEINDKGELVFEQTDIGPITAKLAPNGGDSDYEYWVTVEPKNVNKVLLELICDNFRVQSEFAVWLDNKEIKYNFFSY
jgi:hypothetical protein